MKITIAGQSVFALFGTKVFYRGSIYTKHSASNAEELNLHHEKHELLIIHTVFLWRAISFFASVCIELWAIKSPNAASFFSNTFLFEYGFSLCLSAKIYLKNQGVKSAAFGTCFPHNLVGILLVFYYLQKTFQQQH